MQNHAVVRKCVLTKLCYSLVEVESRKVLILYKKRGLFFSASVLYRQVKY